MPRAKKAKSPWRKLGTIHLRQMEKVEYVIWVKGSEAEIAAIDAKLSKSDKSHAGVIRKALSNSRPGSRRLIRRGGVLIVDVGHVPVDQLIKKAT